MKLKLPIQLPKSWNELNKRQLKKTALLFASGKTGVVFDYAVFKILLNYKWWQWVKYLKISISRNNIDFEELKKHYAWFYSELTLTTFIPVLKNKRKKYYAPKDRLSNLEIDEFSHCEDFLLGFENTQDFEYLQYLAAVLYRDNDASGKRILFDKQELSDRAKLFENTSKATLLAIRLSYQGCRFRLPKTFPNVFPKPKEGNVPAPLPKSSGFGALILNLSGKKFGTHNETKRTNMYTFLADFEELIKNQPNG